MTDAASTLTVRVTTDTSQLSELERKLDSLGTKSGMVELFSNLKEEAQSAATALETAAAAKTKLFAKSGTAGAAAVTSLHKAAKNAASSLDLAAKAKASLFKASGTAGAAAVTSLYVAGKNAATSLDLAAKAKASLFKASGTAGAPTVTSLHNAAVKAAESLTKAATAKAELFAQQEAGSLRASSALDGYTSAVAKAASATASANKHDVARTKLLNEQAAAAQTAAAREATLASALSANAAASANAHEAMRTKLLNERAAAAQTAAAREAALASALSANATASANAHEAMRTKLLNERAAAAQRAAAAESIRTAVPDTASLALLSQRVRGTQQLENAQRLATASTNTFKESQHQLNGALRGVSGSLGALWTTYGAMIPLMTGMAIGKGLRDIVRVGSEVESNLKMIEVVGEGASVAMKDLAEATRGSIFSFEQATDALRILVQAGMSSAEALNTLPTVLKLSTIGEVELGKAALTTAAMLETFGLHTSEAARLTNTMARAAADSPTSVSAMMEAMRQASAISSQYNVTIEETSAALAALADRGIEGSMAGTSFRNLVKELASPATIRANKALTDMGIAIYDANGNIKPLTENLRQLAVVAKGMSEQERIKWFASFTNERAAKSLDVLVMNFDKYEQTVRRVTEAQEGLGFVSEAQAALLTANSNAWKELGADLERVYASVYEELQPALYSLAAALKSVVNSDEFREAALSLSRALVSLVNTVVEYRDALVALAKAAVVYTGFRVATGIVGKLGQALAKLAPLVVTVSGGFAATAAASTTVATAAATATAATTATGVAAAAAATSFTGFAGVLAKTAAFMTGPWGLALGAGLTGLVLLYRKLAEPTPSETTTKLRHLADQASVVASSYERSAEEVRNSTQAFIEQANPANAIAEALGQIGSEAGEATSEVTRLRNELANLIRDRDAAHAAEVARNKANNDGSLFGSLQLFGGLVTSAFRQPDRDNANAEIARVEEELRAAESHVQAGLDDSNLAKYVKPLSEISDKYRKLAERRQGILQSGADAAARLSSDEALTAAQRKNLALRVSAAESVAALQQTNIEELNSIFKSVTKERRELVQAERLTVERYQELLAKEEAELSKHTILPAGLARGESSVVGGKKGKPDFELIDAVRARMSEFQQEINTLSSEHRTSITDLTRLNTQGELSTVEMFAKMSEAAESHRDRRIAAANAMLSSGGLSKQQTQQVLNEMVKAQNDFEAHEAESAKKRAENTAKATKLVERAEVESGKRRLKAVDAFNLEWANKYKDAVITLGDDIKGSSAELDSAISELFSAQGAEAASSAIDKVRAAIATLPPEAHEAADALIRLFGAQELQSGIIGIEAALKRAEDSVKSFNSELSHLGRSSERGGLWSLFNGNTAAFTAASRRAFDSLRGELSKVEREIANFKGEIPVELALRRDELARQLEDAADTIDPVLKGLGDDFGKYIADGLVYGFQKGDTLVKRLGNMLRDELANSLARYLSQSISMGMSQMFYGGSAGSGGGMGNLTMQGTSLLGGGNNLIGNAASWLGEKAGSEWASSFAAGYGTEALTSAQAALIAQNGGSGYVFANALGSWQAGAAGIAGGYLGGKLFDGKGQSQLGGSLGGLGGYAGGATAAAAMGVELGAWAGPIGALTGAVLGAALGSVIKGKTPHKGAVVISGGEGDTLMPATLDEVKKLYAQPGAHDQFEESDFFKRRSEGVADALAPLTESAADYLNSWAKQFGATGTYRVGLGFSADNDSKSRGRFSILDEHGGEIVDFSRRYAKKADAGFKEFAEDIGSGLRDALLAVVPDMEGWMQSALEGLGDSFSLEDLNKVMVSVMGIGDASKDLAEMIGMSEENVRSMLDDSSLERAANQVTSLWIAAKSASDMGLNFDPLGEGAIFAAEKLMVLAGGIEEFGAMQDYAAQMFATPAMLVRKSVDETSRAFEAAGLALPKTAEGFRELIQAQDLLTESGRETYLALLRLAPEFDQNREAILAYAGMTTQDIFNTILDGLTGESTAAELEAALSEQIIDGIWRAAAHDTASQITDLMIGGIIKPAIEAIIAGNGLAQALAGEHVSAVIAEVRTKVDALKTLMSDPEMQALIDDLKASLGGVAGGVGKSVWTQQQAPSRTPASQQGASDQDAFKLIDKLKGETKEAYNELSFVADGLAEFEKALENISHASAEHMEAMAIPGVNLRVAKAVVDAWAEAQVALLKAQNAAKADELLRNIAREFELMGMSQIDKTLADINRQYEEQIKALRDLGQATDANIAQVDKWADAMRASAAASAHAEAAGKALSAITSAGKLLDTISGATGGQDDMYSTLREQRLWAAITNASYSQQIEIAEELTSLVLQRADAESTALQRQIELARQLGSFVDGLLVGNLSPLTTAEKLGEAANQYAETLAKAQGGDEEALAELRGISQSYLDLARTYYASSNQYTGIFNAVTGELKSLAALGEIELDDAQQANRLSAEQLAKLGDLKSILEAAYNTAEVEYDKSYALLVEQLSLLASIDGGIAIMGQLLGSLPAELGGAGNGAMVGYISGLYNKYLARDPEQAGLDYWMGEFSSGRATENTFAYAAYQNQVKDAYKQVLGRDGDADSINWFTQQMYDGLKTLSDVIADIEYVKIHGSHARGLSYVPFDGYTAELHKGERVLTASENAAFSTMNWRNYGGGASDALVAEIKALRAEVSQLRAERKDGDRMIAGTVVASNRDSADKIAEGVQRGAERAAYVQQLTQGASLR